jgi:hypothetical protein
MIAHVGGPQAQVVWGSNGRTVRAKMTRIGTAVKDMIVMVATDGTEFIARTSERGVLEQLTIYEVFEEIEKLHKLIARMDNPKADSFVMPEFIPHLDHKPADEDYVRPNFIEDPKVFI